MNDIIKENCIINDLKKAAKNLASKIDAIKNIATNTELHSYSDLIMGMLRAQHIYIKNETIAKFENSEKGYNTATLHPDDLSITPDGESTAIFANSFGPWNPVEYFNLKGSFEEPRILWILKESFIEDSWFTEYDRGGHNQANEYSDWEKLEYKTHTRVVEISKVLLEELSSQVKEYNEVMNHICILELNHFPGLALKSSGSDNRDNGVLRSWADINMSLLKSLISFYSPNIIIGGGTLQYIHLCLPNPVKSFDKYLIDKIKNKEGLLSNLGYEADSNCAAPTYINGIDNYIIPSVNQGPIFIQANHPTTYHSSMAKKDAQRIKIYLDRSIVQAT